MSMKACVVTGSRNLILRDKVFECLSTFQPDIVIHGACGAHEFIAAQSVLKGADRFAHEWVAQNSNVKEIQEIARWSVHGKKAGPIRNKKMVQLLLDYKNNNYLCKVFAFPKDISLGTRGAIKLFLEAGFEVEIFEC